MRRLTALTAVGTAFFMAALAAFLHWYVAPGTAPPGDLYRVTVTRGSGEAYLNWYRRDRARNAPITMTTTLRQDRVAQRGAMAVIDRFTVLESGRTVLHMEQQRMVFDRVTGEGGRCCGAHVQGDRRVRADGLVYKWPIGAERRTYQVFEPTVRRSLPARFAGAETLYGLTVHRYRQDVPDTALQRVEAPGGMFGRTSRTVGAVRHHSAVRTFWIEPTTGLPVKVVEDRHDRLRAERTEVTLLRARLAPDEATVRQAVTATKEHRRAYTSRRVVLPRAALAAGAIALLCGIALLVSDRAVRRRGARGSSMGLRGRHESPAGSGR